MSIPSILQECLGLCAGNNNKKEINWIEYSSCGQNGQLSDALVPHVLVPLAKKASVFSYKRDSQPPKTTTTTAQGTKVFISLPSTIHSHSGSHC